MTQTPETTPEQQTADLIRKRLLEIAPDPSDDAPDHALVLAKGTAVDAQRYWHRNMSRHPFYSADWDEATKLAWSDSIHAQSFAFAVVHLLITLHRVSPEAANEASRQIHDAWEYGEGVGEWLWLHCHDLGIDTDEVNRLEEAWQALPSSRPGAPEPDAGGLEDAGKGKRTPEAVAGILGLNAGNLVRWSGAAAPGGYVCAVPVPGNPDDICGHPVESEPCPEHRDPAWRPE